MKAYQSLTVWQSDEFEVEVKYGSFPTVSAAASVGSEGIKGICFDKLGLWLDLMDGSRAPVREGDFVVRRLRETAKIEAARRTLTNDDFEVVPMTLQQILSETSMRSFGSQSYGVIDNTGTAMTLP